VKALVGGTLIDGYGGRPIRNSVVLVDGVAMRKEREVGTISPGKYADIIAVKGDVLRYITLLQRVDIVVKHGTRYK
jgi:hypothetical protein